MRHCLDTRGRLGRRAFSMVEILIVIGIITLLAGLALGVGATLRARSHRDSALVLIRRIETALEQYRDVFGSWPSAVRAPPAGSDYQKLADILLGAEVVQPSEVRGGVVVDVWRNPINVIRGGYNTPGLDIWSNGPDGNDNRDPNNSKVYGDDVVNWAGR